MTALSPSNGSFSFGPFGPTLADLMPGARFQRALDVGGGSGANTHRLLTVAREVHAVDADPDSIERARAEYPAIHFHAAPAEEYLAATSDTYDLVVCARVLGFIPHLHALFEPLKQRSTGYLLLSDWHPLACWVTPEGVVGMDYSAQGRFAPDQYHHSIATIINSLLSSGFTIRQVIEGPARRLDPMYRAAPAAVLGLPLMMTWICTSR